jgi:phosphoribosylanthranilate isomerase
MTKVKICGITRPEDAALAVELGADYVGFVFVRESPRSVTPERARACDSSSVPRVGVFRNATAEEIRRAVEIARLDVIQIHGVLPADGVKPRIQAFRVDTTLPDTTTDADYVLFDTGGGTGRTFDWSLLTGYDRKKPFFLAGGITPDNAADAIARVRPDAIDLASGVEVVPGIKDHEKMRRLFEAIQR